MTFEGVLRQKLSTIITIGNKVYPLSVPESVKAPYVCYALAGGEYLKTLDGTEPWQYDYEINVLAGDHKTIKKLEKEVEQALLSLTGEISDDGIVKEVSLDVGVETYEETVKLQRINIQFSIYF